MFRFNFGYPEASTSQVIPQEYLKHDDEKIERNPARNVPFTPTITDSDGSFDAVVAEDNETLLVKKINTIDRNSKKSDLQPGVYEGGFKVWECSLDLLHYLDQRFPSDSASPAGNDPDLKFSKLRVLELGCGHALPALYAMKHGASFVDFQDFNEDVLMEVTMPNIDLNYTHPSSPNVRLFSGSWASLPNLLESERYDLILTAETIYSSSSIPHLVNCLFKLLKPSCGVALIAAKTYYFGVGGGTFAFTRFVESFSIDGYKGIVKKVREYRDGISNVREILELRIISCT